jgi:type I restriction enzyme S subunit
VGRPFYWRSSQIFRGLSGAYNVALIKVIPIKKIQTDYLYYFLTQRKLRKFLERFSQRSGGQSGIEMDILKNYPLPLPKYDEQKKIVNLLSTWDKAIKQIQNQINLKTKLKKGLLQKLLTGQLRLSYSQPPKAFIKTKIGLMPDDWEVKAFTEVFKRISKPVQVESGKKYREIGIRSHGKGVFHKNPVTGAQLGNKRVFHVQPGTLVFNIVFAWEQAVGIFSEKENGFIASHRFPMFRADQAKCLEAFALLFFLSKRGKHGLGIASPGGAGRNKTLGQQELNHLYLPIPPIHEQKKIIHILNLCETEITQLTKQKNALETQKKGLMQKLLTGEIRV